MRTRRINIPLKWDSFFFEEILGKVENRLEILNLVNDNLIASKSLIHHMLATGKENISEDYYWIGYLRFLREERNAFRREDARALIANNKNNFRSSPKEKQHKTETVRLPQKFDEIVSMLSSHFSLLEFTEQDRQRLTRNVRSELVMLDLEYQAVYWLLDSYQKAIERLQLPSFRMEPYLLIKNLPLLLFPDIKEISQWIQQNVEVSEEFLLFKDNVWE